MLTNEKLQLTNNARIMHCLPVRRNVELSDEILDGPNSIITQEAANRVGRHRQCWQNPENPQPLKGVITFTEMSRLLFKNQSREERRYFMDEQQNKLSGMQRR